MSIGGKAFDPDFVLSDFKRNKVCESTGKVKSYSYEFNDVVYTQEHEQNQQSLRFIITLYLDSRLFHVGY
ncbi:MULTISPECIES: hypothetical protein [unclassified Snodgrassella]|uniref:hypothetical protein n=1 Tax=Snodgrassella TaxID=1193515 RepID=UPI0018DD4520|nr:MULTISPECIES: hypothetical protein [unclassified Snodgrassella]MBI0069046.1 hypothetical protein [Snodgrassella sp. M0110]MBI0078041.1 hypothetical protein [Snodgrassella sp. M0118]MBI0080343.1 hypothetical protein [Snodgrassella sp. M0112]